ncbi:efflux RND transporter periplasmic adaptor subunit [Flavobacteriaceae bacterium]|nr:efflux RND transporter periplasmic adaptor subunit [Flavobacteriaceae bacterium]MDB4192194.1 efflux RND transporter periplasmic adaptor subunit [Flavobacteriaceae bacterium]MDB9927795.1 efflux RND transporter periplasmic adaptor subunit [Flavobacteriaceae bacterium]MDC1316336.1 efflux RND transporter periplasmic adaptor subunit [bacterium]MDC1342055.1 efflux RND transporter periplasmic adaptor subunit [Flavobacteriaceae bacterium]|tara:strand:- start:36395 stop:37570 length:1176 start_codon:yes stop_codon:yes gene_type:complete
MKNIYLLFLSAIIFNSCSNKTALSVDEILATNDVAKISSKKIEIDTELERLTTSLNKLNSKLNSLNKDKNTPLITTFKAQEQVFDHFIELQGNVQTKQNVLVYPEMPGILKKVFVKEGQQVVKDQLLAIIDDGGLSQQVLLLEANEQLAKTTFERQKRLWDQKIGSEMQFLQAKTSYNSQKSATKQLKQQLGKFTINAPFSGIIDDVFKEKGTVVAPGQGAEIFRIINLSDMYIETDVPENYITSITKDKMVEVNFPILGETFNSTIRQVGNFINPSNRSFKIEVGVSNLEGKIKPNLTAKLKLNDYTNQYAILIPQSIISENAKGEQFIYIVKDKKENNLAVAERLVIETGKTQGDFIEVTKNLTSDTEIIMEGARSVNNGQLVKVINKN